MSNHTKSMILVDVLLILLLILLLMSGCAHVKGEAVITDEVQQIQFESFTLFKDIRIDPNGVCSTTSTQTESIAGALFGFLVALVGGGI
jgi:uncharacterized protein YcfL